MPDDVSRGAAGIIQDVIDLFAIQNQLLDMERDEAVRTGDAERRARVDAERGRVLDLMEEYVRWLEERVNHYLGTEAKVTT